MNQPQFNPDYSFHPVPEIEAQLQRRHEAFLKSLKGDTADYDKHLLGQYRYERDQRRKRRKAEKEKKGGYPSRR